MNLLPTWFSSKSEHSNFNIIVDFTVPADRRVKFKECEKRDKYLDLARKLKKPWNMKVTNIQIIIGAFGTVTKRTGKRTGGLGNNGTSGDCSMYNIVEIGQNTEKSPGDLRRFLLLKLQ